MKRITFLPTLGVGVLLFFPLGAPAATILLGFKNLTDTQPGFELTSEIEDPFTLTFGRAGSSGILDPIVLMLSPDPFAPPIPVDNTVPNFAALVSFLTSGTNGQFAWEATGLGDNAHSDAVEKSFTDPSGNGIVDLRDSTIMRFEVKIDDIRIIDPDREPGGDSLRFSWTLSVFGEPGAAAIVPEPGSVALAGIGFAALVAYGWRRRCTALRSIQNS